MEIHRAYNLNKGSKNLKDDNETLMNTINVGQIKDNVNSNGELALGNRFDVKKMDKAEANLKYLNQSGFYFNTSAEVNIIGLNTTDDQNLAFDKYDRAFAIYHEIYAHVKLAKSVKDEGDQHREFGNYYYAPGMGLYKSDVTGGSIMVQGSEAWNVLNKY